ncbi:MAG: nuclear transport factor 2 family protein [bacterium]|nr:nuclear transport factor 2 family protein [bacterium]
MSESNENITTAIIDLERGALTRWIDGDPWGFVEIAADDIVYFDPFTEMRITGIEAFKAHMEPIKGQINADHFRLLNPNVQVLGDGAVLTFNFCAFNGEEPDTLKSTWNSTEVYARIDDEWRLIQSHWSLTTPELK